MGDKYARRFHRGGKTDRGDETAAQYLFFCAMRGGGNCIALDVRHCDNSAPIIVIVIIIVKVIVFPLIVLEIVKIKVVILLEIEIVFLPFLILIEG